MITVQNPNRPTAVPQDQAAIQGPSPGNPCVPSEPRSQSGSTGGFEKRDPWFRALCLGLALAAALLYGSRLGSLDFWAPDEPRYGAIAEEIRSFEHGPGGLFLLHLNGEPYTQKPPLYFWLAALAGVPSGHVSESAARLPSALAGVLSVVLTAFIARTLLRNPLDAVLAAGLLATSFRFVFSARRAQLDVLLTLLELIAVALFVHLEFRQRSFTPRGAVSRLSVAGLHGALGLAALVKGPVAWLPLAVFLAYLATQGRAFEFRKIAPAWAFALSIGPVVAWILTAIALGPPGFAEVAVGENLWGRFFSGTSHARPFYYFLIQTPADFLPWTLLIPFAVGPIRARLALERIQDSQERDPRGSPTVFVLLWFALPLLFFSLSAGKRGVYLLPFFPALAILAVLGASGWLAGGGGRIRSRWALGGIAAVAIVEWIVAVWVLPASFLPAEKSPRPVALAAAARTRPDQAIGLYGLAPWTGPIGYYGGRRTQHLADAEELRAHLEQEAGAVALLRLRDFEALRSRIELEAVETFRSGPRSLVLARLRRSDPLGKRSREFPLSPAPQVPRSPDMRRFSD